MGVWCHGHGFLPVAMQTDRFGMVTPNSMRDHGTQSWPEQREPQLRQGPTTARLDWPRHATKTGKAIRRACVLVTSRPIEGPASRTMETAQTSGRSMFLQTTQEHATTSRGHATTRPHTPCLKGCGKAECPVFRGFGAKKGLQDHRNERKSASIGPWWSSPGRQACGKSR